MRDNITNNRSQNPKPNNRQLFVEQPVETPQGSTQAGKFGFSVDGPLASGQGSRYTWVSNVFLVGRASSDQ